MNVLEHFLEDVRRHNGRYLGFPRLGITHQHLESPALRGNLRMSPEQTGVMVTGVQVRDGVCCSNAAADSCLVFLLSFRIVKLVLRRPLRHRFD